MENTEEVPESSSQQNASALLHLLPVVTRRVGDVASQLSPLTTLLGEIPSALKKNAFFLNALNNVFKLIFSN